MGVCGISHRFQWLSPTPGQIPTRYSPVRRCPPPEGGFSLDLHVLGLPPAFVLSQDQTLTLLTPVRIKQTDKHKSRPSILKHLQNTRNNFNAPNKHTNADRASLPTSNNSLCQRTAPKTARPPGANSTAPSEDVRAVGGAYTPGLEWCQSVIAGFFHVFEKSLKRPKIPKVDMHGTHKHDALREKVTNKT